jgi:single-stranded-DNA-specific exonuclease
MIASAVAPQWVAHPARDEVGARDLALALGAPHAIAQVLVNRGCAQLDAAQEFLSPTLDRLASPSRLTDLEQGVERIRRAIANREPVLVQGDYDVDGITSTFLLQRTLERLGGHVHVRIPHRTRDGYGLSASAVTEAGRLGCRLIVTVDCGIGALQEIEQAKALGIDTVVTDHHAPGPRLPSAHAVVNPRRHDCSYPFKSLAGVGVTFKLAQTLLEPLDRELAWEFLDVVALGTIADVVPLIGENRALAGTVSRA